MFDVSVIICTHNPRLKYLERALHALSEQKAPTEFWELIVVDNASREPIANSCDLSWHPHARHVVESELGLASARQRGIAESTGRLLIFVDDDNVLAPSYLQEALRIERDFPFLGTWGSGSIDLEFESKPASHLESLLPWLAFRDVKRPVWSNAISCTEATPIGAGLCVRRQIAEAYRNFYRTSSIQISGRKGLSLGGHEDFEICYLACRAGLGMGMFPELKILHLIAPERTTDEHLIRLVEGVTLSKLLLAYKWEGALPKSPFSIIGAVKTALSLCKRRSFDRRIRLAELRAVIAARSLCNEIAGKACRLDRN